MPDSILLTGADLTPAGVVAVAGGAGIRLAPDGLGRMRRCRMLSPLDPRVLMLRPQAGQIEAAAGLMLRLEGSALTRPGAARRVQDPLSLRCVAQIHGAVTAALATAAAAATAEINGASDNPAVLEATGEIASHGGFLTPHLTVTLGALAQALVQFATAQMARMIKLQMPRLTDLPDGFGSIGFESTGMTPAMKSAEALLAEIIHLAQPMLAFGSFSSSGVEDIAAHSAVPARALLDIVERLHRLTAMELMVAAQAVELRAAGAGVNAGAGTEAPCLAAAIARVRADLPAVAQDTPLGCGIERLAARVAAGDFELPEGIMSVWTERPTIRGLTEVHVGTAVQHLGIEFLEIGDDWLSGRMPVDHRTVQPYGIVHGGASVLLAETLGSSGAVHCVDRARFVCVGQEVNANHVRPARAGWVTGIARPLHLGRLSQIWSIELRDEDGRLTCVSRLTVAVLARPDGA